MATLPGRNHDKNRGNYQKQEKTIKKTANTAANEQKHKQDSWKQFVEPNSKMLMVSKVEEYHEIKPIV